MGRIERRAALPLLALPVLCLVLAWTARAEHPDWWENDIGRAEVVLPGFDPVEVEGTTVAIGSRRYVWNGGFLPGEIVSRGATLTNGFRLVAGTAGNEQELRAERVEIVEAVGHHAVVRATGEPLDGLQVELVTRVEYDGVALSTLTLRPTRPVALDGLRLQADVVRRPSTRMLKFSADAIRGQWRRHEIEPRYRGDFLNVVGFPDGDRSFWWFADDAEGWIWNGPAVTEVRSGDDTIQLVQHLIGAPHVLSAPLTLRFNFMATPVKELGSAWRKERAVASATKQWAGLGRYQLWWDTVFSHIVLPYTQLPADVAPRVPQMDRAAYPGRERNRELMAEYPRKFGFYRIPYFSLHVLSSLDPVVTRYREQWEVVPPFVNKSGHTRRTTFEKPTLSHRAEPYRNYLLHRFSEEIESLDMPGIYFDQGKVMDSRNPNGAGWTDSEGRLQPALDILGTRAFLKRLAVRFHELGQPGWIFVHNSTGEIPPAYGFATAWVVGEEFRHHLEQDDYVASITLDNVRTQFSPDQFGTRVMWVPQFFYFHKKAREEWKVSPAARAATRNFLALNLLHDIEANPAGLHFETWRELLAELDDFGVDRAAFVGYWDDSGIRAASPNAPVSHYRRGDQLLLVVANLSERDRTISVDVDRSKLGFAAGQPLLAGAEALRATETRFPVPVPARDFRLVWLRPGDA